ncbi:2-oxo-4-hydroxy-4-carboxy-5-ureidoimidazoline decarboxylase [Verrucomicrobiales bacterium]|nr:2-oxo-4-hydroxy-4-carboxy-5-ureidoimidazoline decarboxylase [Verrucomicrobiales bacterium]
MPSLTSLNETSEAEFLETLGGVYESSPWVARAAFLKRPFAEITDLAAALQHAVDSAPEEKQRDLILAHPDLGGKLGQRKSLTPESAREQSSLGLDRLEDKEYERFTELNTRYRRRFGFPFIICVALVGKAEILEAFEKRLENSEEQEFREALKQIHLIAGNRLQSLVTG